VVRFGMHLLSNSAFLQQEELRRVASAIRSTKSRITSIMTKRQTSDNIAHAAPFLHILHVFDAELSSNLCDWDQLLKAIQVGDDELSGNVCGAGTMEDLGRQRVRSICGERL
jgi:hypothetical protein